MLVHTHVRLVTSRQPARSSATKGLRSARAICGSRIAARKTALTANVAASTAIAQAEPPVATTTPATTGLAREPVGPHAAAEHEHDARDQHGHGDEAEIRCRASQLDDGERERDRVEPVPERRHRLARPQKPELLLLERPQTAVESHRGERN